MPFMRGRLKSRTRLSGKGRTKLKASEKRGIRREDAGRQETRFGEDWRTKKGGAPVEEKKTDIYQSGTKDNSSGTKDGKPREGGKTRSEGCGGKKVLLGAGQPARNYISSRHLANKPAERGRLCDA